ncbi:MAG: DUF362 domain-containing protein [Candidatus Latescibacterota bacterium]
MIDRRTFLASGAAAFSALHIPQLYAQPSKKDLAHAAEYLDPGMHLVRHAVKWANDHKKGNVPPALREEILENPSAVFVVRTSVVSQKDSEGKFPPDNEQFQREGYRVAQLIFRKGSKKGGQTLIQPNYVGGFTADRRSVNNGVSTHPSFVAGFGDALRELGNTNIVIGANGAAKHEHFVQSGVAQMMHEHGLFLYEGKYENWSDYVKSEVTWIDNPEGVVMKKVPYFSLIQAKDTTLINLAKDRIHQLGFTTLTLKNTQGTMPVGYMHICQPWNDLKRPISLQPGKKIFNPDYQREIEKRYVKHAQMNFKYWDEGGYCKAYFDSGGYEAFKKGANNADYKLFWGEQWGQRMMDVVSNVHPAVCLVEGIVGVDGGNALHLNNFVTVSRSMVSCDSLAAWLMGHDPRELPFLRIANERGLGENDIDRIPVYEISEKGVAKIDYRNLPRAKMGVHVYSEKGAPLRFF